MEAASAQPLAYTPYGYRKPGGAALGFNGERLDPITHHYALGQGVRIFNTVLMRFNSADGWSPFGKGGLNAYAYCSGDPVNFTDPSGHIIYSPRIDTGMRNWRTRSRISTLYKKAPAAKAYIDDLGADLASHHGGNLITAPLKARARATEKIMTTFGGDPRKINDVARNTLVVESNQTQAVVHSLSRLDNVSLSIIKAENTPVGYSGIHAKIATPAGPLAEMQIHTPEMIYANLPMNVARQALGAERYGQLRTFAQMHGYEGGQGHKYYEVYRAQNLSQAVREEARQAGRDYYSFMNNGYIRL